MVTVRETSDAEPQTKKQYRHNLRFFGRALWSSFYYSDLTRDWFRMGHNLKDVSATNLLLSINPARRDGDNNFVYADSGTPVWNLRGAIKTMLEGDRASGALGISEGSRVLDTSYSEFVLILQRTKTLCDDFSSLSSLSDEDRERFSRELGRISLDIEACLQAIETKRDNVKSSISAVQNNVDHLQKRRAKILEEVVEGDANKQGGTEIARLAAYEMGESFDKLAAITKACTQRTEENKRETVRTKTEINDLISNLRNANGNIQSKTRVASESLDTLVRSIETNRTTLCLFTAPDPDQVAAELVDNLDQTEDAVTSYTYRTQYRRLLPIGTQLFTEMPAGIVERRLTKADKEKYGALVQAGQVVPLPKHFQIGEDTTTKYPLIKEVLSWWPGRPRSTSVKPDEQKWIENVWGKLEGKLKRTPTEIEVTSTVLEKLISLVPNYGHDQGLESLIWLGLNYSNVKPEEQPKDKPRKGAKRLIGDRGGGIPNGITQALTDYDTKLVQAGKKPLFGPDFINKVTFITSQQESTFANNLRFGRSLASQDRWYFRMPQDLINELFRRSDSSHGGAWNWVTIKRLNRWFWPFTTLANTIAALPGVSWVAYGGPKRRALLGYPLSIAIVGTPLAITSHGIEEGIEAKTGHISNLDLGSRFLSAESTYAMAPVNAFRLVTGSETNWVPDWASEPDRMFGGDRNKPQATTTGGEATPAQAEKIKKMTPEEMKAWKDNLFKDAPPLPDGSKPTLPFNNRAATDDSTNKEELEKWKRELFKDAPPIPEPH